MKWQLRAVKRGLPRVKLRRKRVLPARPQIACSLRGGFGVDVNLTSCCHCLRFKAVGCRLSSRLNIMCLQGEIVGMTAAVVVPSLLRVGRPTGVPKKRRAIMHKSSIRYLLTSAMLGLALSMVLAVEEAARAQDDNQVTIVISPSTLNLESSGIWVTVHAEIPYSNVVGASVTLDGIPVEVTFADNRGELVAKFCIDDVKDSVRLGEVRLTLVGDKTDGSSFFGTDLVKVISVKGK
ncbi:MAG: hypothetical protein H7A46_19775 [Verrucomicrobiales bacterium]|nr:hypothetical protein [Verrucomicrobiales bacterium]